MSRVVAASPNASKQVLKGWLEIPKRKVSQNLRFFKLRGHLDQNVNSPTSCQLVSRHPFNSHIGQLLDSVTPESCVSVTVQKLFRPTKNQRAQDGDVGVYEYEIQDLHVLNMAVKNLPFLPNNERGVDTLVRAQNRQIEMRSEALGGTLRERARLRTQLRNALENQGFMEVETPLLFKSTPEGAREFLVPTRRKDQFFALPQSPQQYKQILMAGGIHRYYQFAKCFRDEDSRADRQLEFTQLDLEMAFVDMEDVMSSITKTVLSVDAGKPFDVQDGHIRRMKYQDAMSKYGSDKPDLRFALEIQNIDIEQVTAMPQTVDFIEFVLPDRTISSNAFRELQQSLKIHSVYAVRRTDSLSNLPAIFQDVAARLPAFSGPSIMLLSKRSKPLSGGSTAMGQGRLLLQAFLERHNLVSARPHQPFQLCWITDFPLFSPTAENEPGQGGTLGLSSTHHPFTAPHPEDVHLLGGSVEDLKKVRGLHYDLVMNGVEIGGGSIRIHDSKQQKTIFQVLGMSEDRISQFSHLLKVLESGCPPHGGFAMGFDRFVAMMCAKQSIRDVIAFPKTSSGVDPLIGSPSYVSPETLQAYHILTIAEK